MEPIFANCTSCSARASTLAPQSTKSMAPFTVGITGASGALFTPLIFPAISWPPTNTAPVLPQETNASAFCSFTSLSPTTSEESFLVRTDSTGGAPVSITSDAGTISSLDLSYVSPSSALFNSSGRPVKSTFMLLFLLTASTAPCTIQAGALSPPIPSTATVIILFLPFLLIHRGVFRPSIMIYDSV